MEHIKNTNKCEGKYLGLDSVTIPIMHFLEDTVTNVFILYTIGLFLCRTISLYQDNTVPDH